MTSATPWHQPGKFLVNPAYWDEAALAERSAAPKRMYFIDCSLSEGDDCVAHQLNWNTRLGLMERLDAIGVGEITLPSHTRFEEEKDLVRAYRRLGLKTRLAAKGPGIHFPKALKGDWKGMVNHTVDLGAETICPLFVWPIEETITDFGSGDLSKQAIVDTITEVVSYAKTQKVRVVPWVSDSTRGSLDSACLFFGAIAKAGGDGIYAVDSRGNSAPLATKIFTRRVRAAIGPDCDFYFQFHNDLGVATANAMAAVENGANWIDCAVMGIADRGGCVALEEAAVLLELYGIRTGIKLEGLYELGMYAQKAFGVSLAPWKPILGENWNKEEGYGHMAGGESAESTIAVNPEVIGRSFEGVIGAKILFGRERSSAWTSDPIFLRKLIEEWGMRAEEEQFQTILHRARTAVANTYDRHYITLEEFRAICDGVLL